MTTAITTRRIGIIENRFRMPKKEPTQEQLHAIAPTCNLMFALSMVLESYTLELKESNIYELACKIRSNVHELVPDSSEAFGEWADEVENQLNATKIKKSELMQWVIAKIYALSFDLTNFYRQFDTLFQFFEKDTILRLKMSQKNFNPKIAKELNEIVKRIMES